MLMCWNEQAQERPSFLDLRSKFEAMLLEDKKEEYIHLHNIDQSNLYYQQFPGPAIEGVIRSSIDSSMLSPTTDHKGTMREYYLSKSATELHHSQFRMSAISGVHYQEYATHIVVHVASTIISFQF